MITFNKDYRIRQLSFIGNINNVNESYTDIYTYDGVGWFDSCVLDFDNDGVLIRFVCDDVEIGVIDLEEYMDLTGSIDYRGKGIPGVDTGDDIFFFNPSYPIEFKKNFKIQCKANDGNNTRDFIGGVLSIVERS